jgi:hypothetical protein
MPILPIVILVALDILALEAWAFSRALKGDRVSLPHVVLLAACCLILWLGTCLFFAVFASLGHSPQPLLDSWPQSAVSFLVLVVAPLAAFLWRVRRRAGKGGQ